MLFRKLACSIALGAFTLGVVMSGASADPVSWRVHADQPATFWWSQDLETFAQSVDKASGGSIKLAVYPSSSLGVPADAILSAVSSGKIEMAEFVASYVSGEAPHLTILGLPMISNSITNARERMNVVRKEQSDQLSKDYGLRILATLTSTPLQLYLGKRSFNGIESLKGLRIRTLGPDQDQFVESLGAFPTSIPVGEITTAVASNQVDGVIAGIPLILGQKLVDFGPTILAWDAILSPGFLTISEKRWNELSLEQQAALSSISEEFENLIWTHAEQYEEKYRAEATAAGYEIVKLDDASRAALAGSAQGVWQAWADRNGPVAAGILGLVK